MLYQIRNLFFKFQVKEDLNLRLHLTLWMRNSTKLIASLASKMYQS